MFALDLFNNDHERRLVEGAVDQLEQRRIDDLAMKMDDLVARAKTATTAEVKAALMKEFQKCKAERDSYHMVRNETMGYGLGEEKHEFKGAHGKLDVERTPGKTVVTRKEYPDSDEMRADRFPNKRLKGLGTGTAIKGGSGVSSGQGSMRKFPKLDHDANDAPNYDVDEAGIPGPGNQIGNQVVVGNSPTKSDSELKAQEVRREKQTILRNIAQLGNSYAEYKWAGEHNVFMNTEQIFDYLDQTVEDPDLTALEYMYNKGYSIEGLIKGMLKSLAKDGLSRADIFRLWKSSGKGDLKPTPGLLGRFARAVSRSVMGNTVSEAGDVKAKTDDALRAHWEKVKKEKQAGITSSVPVEKIPGKADLLKGRGRSYYENQKKNSEQVAEEEQQLAIASKYTGDGQFQITANNEHKYIVTIAGFEINPSDTGILDSFYLTDAQTGKTKHVASTNSPLEEAIYEHLWYNQRPALKQIYAEDMAFYEKHGWNNGRPERLEGLPLTGWNAIPADRFVKAHQDMKKVTGQDISEGERLHQGDPIVVIAPNEFEGKTGEIHELSPSGKFVIVNLYNHGKHSMHLSDVEFNQYADDQAEEDDWYDDADEFGKPGSEFFPEGYQDFNKVEPYAVCLAGKPVKKFDYYEEARRFHDNWKQKLYREGNKEKADKITLMPLNLDEVVAAPPPEAPPAIIAPAPATKYMAQKPQAPKAQADVAPRHAKVSPYSDDESTLKIYKPEQYRDVNEAEDRVDPILIKALNNMPDGLATHHQVLDAAYDAYAMELGKMRMKSEYGTTHVYIPKLMGLYKDKHGLTFNEEQKPAGPNEFRPVGPITIVPPKKLKSGETYQDRNKYWQSQGQAPIYKTNESEGSWIVYDPETKQIKKRFKTHTAGKSYAKVHGLGFASSEFYFDRVKDNKEVAETSLDELSTEKLAKYKKAAGADASAADKRGNTERGNKRFKGIVKATIKQGDNDAKKHQGIAEAAMSNLHAELSDVYNRMAPGIERNRDSFKAGQLYDALEAVAEQHGAETEFKRMMAGARNRAHMDYDTNPGGFQNWFWYLPFDQEELSEEQDTSGVERAILNRIMVAHTDLLMKFGPDKVMQAAEEVAYNVGDVDEIGTSDVSAYVKQVQQILGA